MTRRDLRENIFKILFKCEFNSAEEMEEQIDFSIDELELEGKLDEESEKYITDKCRKILAVIKDIDPLIADASNGWSFERIGKAELAIMRLAVYEMKYDDDIPVSVAINEAVELSKRYCNEDSKRYVNGVLSKING